MRRHVVTRAGALTALLHAAHREIPSARTLPALFQIACDATITSDLFAAVVICVPSDVSKAINITASACKGGETVQATWLSMITGSQAAASGPVWTAWRNLAPCIVSNIPIDHAGQQAPVTSIAAVPILNNGKGICVMVFFSDRQDAFDADEMAVLQFISNSISVTVALLSKPTFQQSPSPESTTRPDNAVHPLDGMPEAYYETDLHGNLTRWNAAFPALLGQSLSEPTGKTIWNLQTPATIDALQQAFKDVKRTGTSKVNHHWECLHKSGRTVRGEGSISLVNDAHGNATGFRGILRDVSDRHAAEHALRSSEASHRTILEGMEDAYYETDLEGRHLRSNRALFRMTGHTAEELISRGIRTRQTPEMAKQTTKLFGEVYRTGVPLQGQHWQFLNKDGQVVSVEGSIHLVKDAAGEPVGFRGIMRDISQSRREERLLALEHQIALELPDASTIRSGVRMVIRKICEAEQWESGGYWVRYSESDMFRLETGWTGSAAADEFYKEKIGKLRVNADSYLKEVWETGNPAWVTDASKDPRLGTKSAAQAIYTNRAMAIFYVPVQTNGEVVAVLSFTNTAIVEPDQRLLKTVLVIASQLSQFLRRRHTERILRESEERFRALTNLSSDWYWEQDAAFRFTRMESHLADKDGIKPLLLGKSGWESGFDIQEPEGWHGFRCLIESRAAFRNVIMYRTIEYEKPYYISVSGEPILQKDGSLAGYRGVAREITEQKVAEQRIQYLATHDGLTGLPNRVLFSHLLNNAISSAQRYGRNFAVLFVDLDRFKFINDTLGHEAGDLLLKEITARFKKAARTSDIVARLGGDEFVVLVHEVTEPSQAAAVARKLLSAASEPVTLAGQECGITASIGIAMYPTAGEDEQSLMKNADIAMYFAKDEGKNNFQFYSTGITTQSLERLKLENNLRVAMERSELTLHYQPKLSLKDGSVHGAEALLRWTNPELGVVSPDKFIPVAEETGLIIPIGKWVLRAACAQNRAWQKQGLPPICIAVNLSVRQFSDPDLLTDIATVLQDTGMDPQWLELEITEGMVSQHPEQANALLHAIKKMGVRLAIDDFGTGYSSMGQLKNYPIDTLKIDRSFIRDIGVRQGDNAITQAIIAMGKALGLTVVAEGVETLEQREFLRVNACDELQGYYFSRPIPAQQFTAFIAAHAAAVAHHPVPAVD